MTTKESKHTAKILQISKKFSDEDVTVLEIDKAIVFKSLGDNHLELSKSICERFNLAPLLPEAIELLRRLNSVIMNRCNCSYTEAQTAADNLIAKYEGKE